MPCPSPTSTLRIRALRAWLLALSALALAPTLAAASGFSVPALGPTSSGVTTPGPTSVHLNPGGLGFADRLRIVIGGDLLIARLRYQRVRRATYQAPDSLDFQLPIDPSAVDPEKTGTDREVATSPIGLIPTVFAETPLGKLPLVLGLGIDAPYAAIVRWPGAGPQRFALDDATLATVFTNASLAWRVSERLSLGVGVTYVVGFASLSRVQDLASVDDLGKALARPPIAQPNGFGPRADPALRELDTFARPFSFERGFAHGLTFRAGMLAEIHDHLFLGASYEHSTRLDFRGDFRLDMNDPFFTQDLASQGLDYPAQVRGRASLSFTLPKVVRLGLRYDFGPEVSGAPRSSLALEASYTGWSSVDAFDVRLRSAGLAQPALGLGQTLSLTLPRAWRDTYGGVVRLSHAASEELSLWLALGGESAAVPDRTLDAASPDGARVTGSAGLSRALSRSLRVVLDLTYQHVLTRRVAASDYDLANGTYKMFLLSGGAFLDYRY